MKKRGLSGVVGAMILIVLVVSSIGIVWVIVNSIIKEGVEEANSCFGIFEKVTINNEYTCYRINVPEPTNNKVHFSISIGDVEVDEVLVSITESDAQSSDAFEISKSPSTISNVEPYPEGSGTTVSLPGKNGGRTYIVSGFSSRPDSVQITPVIDGKICKISDTLYGLDNCPP